MDLHMKTCIVTSKMDEHGLLRSIVHATRLAEELEAPKLHALHQLEKLSFEELEAIAAGLVQFQQAVEIELANRWVIEAGKATCSMCQPAPYGVDMICDDCNYLLFKV